jgi:hypothetical protein
MSRILRPLTISTSIRMNASIAAHVSRHALSKRFIAMKMCRSNGGIIFRSTPITLSNNFIAIGVVETKKGKSCEKTKILPIFAFFALFVSTAFYGFADFSA